MATKAVAKKQATGQDLALAGEVFGSMASEGLENVSSRDIAIPRLVVLQKLSPQCDPESGEYIEGAKPGMICDTGVQEVFDKVMVVPVHYAMIYLEWAPRDSNKGLVKNHGTDGRILEHCKADERNRQFLPNGNYVAETATYYVLNITAGGRRSFIPMSSTQLKTSRRWMTTILGQKLARPDGTEFTPPIFYRAFELSTVSQENAQGKWFGWKVEKGPDILELDPSQALLANAKEFHRMAAEGLVQGDVSQEEPEAAAPQAGDAM